MDLPVFMPRPIPHKRQVGGGRWGYWLLQTSLPHGRPCIWTPWLPWDPSISRLLDVSTQASTSNLPQHTSLMRAPPFINPPAAPTCPGFLVHLVFPLIEGSTHGNKMVLRNGENREEKPNFHQNHNPPRIVQHRGLCSVLCGALDGREIWRRMDTCLCVAESLGCSPETLPTLFIGYTQHKIKSLKKKPTMLKLKFPINHMPEFPFRVPNELQRNTFSH